MPEHIPPQPHPDRLTDFAAHPLVVGVVEDQPPLVVLTAASLAAATGGELYVAFVDTSRVTEEERPDGTVRHVPIDPDLPDDVWTQTEERMLRQVREALAGNEIRWHFRYLAGRVDRALTHLARAVDAAAFVIGTHDPGHHHGLDFLHQSVGVQLAHRQHRPVVSVPLSVVDWKARAPWE